VISITFRKDNIVMKKRELAFYELKIAFNDIALRELGLSVDDEDHVCDDESETILTIKDSYLKYSDEEYPIINHGEIELNLLENPHLMEILFGVWVKRRAESKGLKIVSFYQSSIRGTDRAQFIVNYEQPDSSISESKSDLFVNESVRILNLICKLNHTDHLYDFKTFDIDLKKNKK